MMAQFRQPDFSQGDPNTLGGYMAVHDRPAAFEGSDGFSYSVEILAEHEADAPDAPDAPARGAWSAYLFFVRWARIGASAPAGHLESDVLVRAADEPAARARVGAMSLGDVKRVLDDLIARADTAGGSPRRKWWDAMSADDPGAPE